MTIRRRTIAAIICAVAMLAVLVSAQERRPRQGFAVGGGQGGQVVGLQGHFAFEPQGDNTFVFVSSEMSFDGKLVKGAPYSAQATTEMIQTLADGNRIVRRNTASVFRDSEGRTRREQTIDALGAFAASGDPQQLIFINDPVAQVNYILDTKNRTARKIDLSFTTISGPEGRKRMADARARTEERAAGDSEQEKVQTKIEIARSSGFQMRPPGPGGIGFGPSITMRSEINSRNSKKESLGKQMIEGVEAEGTRYTTTIAAGEIGNEAPIIITSETWYSPELQTVVMSKHSDPRMGENTYRLTNINRSEPPHSLFELPSDYTIKETIEPGVKLKVEQETRRRGPDKQVQ
jgi:hypothetical protein